MFLEFWKRYSQEMTHRWDTTNFTPEEEHPRPEYLEQLKHVDELTVNVITQTTEPKVPYWTRKIPGVVMSASTVILMVLIGELYESFGHKRALVKYQSQREVI